MKAVGKWPIINIRNWCPALKTYLEHCLLRMENFTFSGGGIRGWEWTTTKEFLQHKSKEKIMRNEPIERKENQTSPVWLKKFILTEYKGLHVNKIPAKLHLSCLRRNNYYSFLLNKTSGLKLQHTINNIAYFELIFTSIHLFSLQISGVVKFC